MSASRLREAAALMRQRAEVATSGPWMVDGDEPSIVLKPDQPGNCWDGTVVATVPEDDFGLVDHADSEHIAGWSPEPALAVAALLDDYARQVDESAGLADFGTLADDSLMLAVANAYLGTTP